MAKPGRDDKFGSMLHPHRLPFQTQKTRGTLGAPGFFVSETD